MAASDFYNKYLFQPLNMDSTRLAKDETGNDIVFGGAITTIEDAAQLALMVMNKGIYKGRRIVSEAWVEQSTTPSGPVPYYGYLWWLSPEHTGTPKEHYTAMGDRGKVTMIFPEKDLIYLRRNSCMDLSRKNMNWMGTRFIEMVANVVK